MPERTEYDDTQAARRLRVQVTALRRAVKEGAAPRPDVRGYLWSRGAVEAIDRAAVRAFERPPARRTEYDAGQAAGRLGVPVTAFRWCVHTTVVPAPDVRGCLWSRAAVEAMDAEAVRAAMPEAPITGGAAADRLAEAVGTPNVPGQAASVTVFAVRRLVDAGLLVELSGNASVSMVHPAQVAEVAGRADLAELLAAAVPVGPDQAAARLGVRRVDWDRLVGLGWIKPAEWRDVKFGAYRGGTVTVPLYLAREVDALPAAHPEVDWPALRAVEKGRRSPLAALSPVVV
ncbi:hypothetical protein [Streptomyces violascens]|uniref:hypothetical protein n=1 Tax=Streptomyces violascens TaxID=67381 RepID=UPI00199F80BE|nr:hypothetical protein [Streptomyces violascens]GGU51235.1 hypothetical protein GCM10010289_84590 [Streptomyces violascens]